MPQWLPVAQSKISSKIFLPMGSINFQIVSQSCGPPWATWTETPNSSRWDWDFTSSFVLYPSSSTFLASASCSLAQTVVVLASLESLPVCCLPLLTSFIRLPLKWWCCGGATVAQTSHRAFHYVALFFLFSLHFFFVRLSSFAFYYKPHNALIRRGLLENRDGGIFYSIGSSWFLKNKLLPGERLLWAVTVAVAVEAFGQVICMLLSCSLVVRLKSQIHNNLIIFVRQINHLKLIWQWLTRPK